MLKFNTAGQTTDLSATDRSSPVYLPALSTVCVYINGTASVKIVSNPFESSSKDYTLATLTASGNTVLSSANIIVLDVTITSGTVSISVIPNSRSYLQ